MLGTLAGLAVVLYFWQPWKTRISEADLIFAAGQYWYVQDFEWTEFDALYAGYFELYAIAHPRHRTPERFSVDEPLFMGVCDVLLSDMHGGNLRMSRSQVFRMDLRIIDTRTDEHVGGAPIEVLESDCVAEVRGLDGKYRYPNPIRDWPLTKIHQAEADEGAYQTILTFERDRDSNDGLTDFDFTYACRAVMAAPPPNLFEDVYTADISTVRIRAEIKRGFSLAYASAFLWQDFRVAGEQCLPLGPVEET